MILLSFGWGNLLQSDRLFRLVSQLRHFKSWQTSSNPAPPLQNHIFPLEKRRFEDDSGDSQDDSPGAKAAHKTTQHLQAWTCMDRQESQSNWPEMRKTLGKPKFQNEAAQNPTRAAKHVVRWHRARQRSSKTNILANDPIHRVTTLSPFRIYRVTSKTPERV